MDRFRIMPMELKDLDGVKQIENLSFNNPWSRAAYENELCENELAHYFTVKDGDKVIAYGGMWLILDEAHITNFAVHPEYRKRGIGKKLLRGIINFGILKGIKSFTLEVKKSNSIAIGLYSGMGFVKAGIRKGYYSDTGEDALIMWLDIKGYPADDG